MIAFPFPAGKSRALAAPLAEKLTAWGTVAFLLYALGVWILAGAGYASVPRILPSDDRATQAMLFATPDGIDALRLRADAGNPLSDDFGRDSEDQGGASPTFRLDHPSQSIPARLAFPPEDGIDERARLSLLADASNMVFRNGETWRLYRADEHRSYQLLSDPAARLVTEDARRQTLLYTTVEKGRLVLHIASQRCQLDDPSVLAESGDPRLAEYLYGYALPEQRTIRLSPSGTRLLALDHGYGRRISVADLISRTATTLKVPGFTDEQVHFSPMYDGDDAIIFSVFDGENAGTIRYDGLNDKYERLTDEFTDAGYRASDGAFVFLRSVSPDGASVPFGSRVLGPAASRGKRELRILRGRNIRDMAEEDRLPYQLAGDDGWFQYRENIGPLLAALKVPPAVRNEYEALRKKAERTGGRYVLVDAY